MVVMGEEVAGSSVVDDEELDAAVVMGKEVVGSSVVDDE